MRFAEVARWGPRGVTTALIFGARVVNAVNCTEGCVVTIEDYGVGNSPSLYNYTTCPDRILTSQSDADVWGTCTNFTGNVVIQSNNLTNITLNGFESIERGSLIAANCSQLVEVSAPDLVLNYGNITLSNLPLLKALDFPRLEYVEGTLLWDSLPLLTNINFGSLAPSGGHYSYGDLDISNTGLTSINFYTHYHTFVEVIEIRDNPQLSFINLTSISSVDTLTIVGNGPSATVLLSNMTRCQKNLSLSNTENVDLRNLRTVDFGNIVLFNNSFKTFLAPQLDSAESLYVTNNPQLSTLSFPNLYQIGDAPGDGNLVVTNNPLLQSIIMNDLNYPGTSVVLTGDLWTIAMQSLEDLPIHFYLNSTNPNLNCTGFDKLNYEYLTFKASKGENHTLPSSYNYSCSAYPPGSTKDVALHYHPPRKSPWDKMSKAERIVVVIASVVVGWTMLWAAYRFWRKKHPKPQPEQRGGIDGDEVDLDDLTGGVIREEEDAVHRPPQYRRVAKPHEVPPGYTVELNEVRSSEVEG